MTKLVSLIAWALLHGNGYVITMDDSIVTESRSRELAEVCIRDEDSCVESIYVNKSNLCSDATLCECIEGGSICVQPVQI